LFGEIRRFLGGLRGIVKLSNKDKLMRIKISRKEAKESAYWLRLIDINNNKELDTERKQLTQEANELTNIFGSIALKLKEKLPS